MTEADRNPRKLDEFKRDIADLEETVKGLGHRVAEAHSERSLLGFQAEWHVRGILYHLRRLDELHASFVHEVSGRASTGANVIVMYAPSYQHMLFEFYALVNLCRISLDNLRIYLAPLFQRSSDQLPKSIRDVLKGTTNCSVYNVLSGHEVLTYLLDLRNCLVHYRSFATSDNAYVVEEGVDSSNVVGGGDEYFEAMARADFRRVGEDAIAVNVLLPDRIFETNASGNKRLVEFTYKERWSLLSMARSFAQLAIMSLQRALQCLTEISDPAFEFRMKKREPNNRIESDK